MAAVTAQTPIVSHGRRALASPMRRRLRCMTVLLPVRCGRRVRRGGARGSPCVPGPARSPAGGRVGPPP
jgi:hypothetical protein